MKNHLPHSAFRLPLSAFLLALLAAAPLHAQSWNGNGTTDWGTTTNWTPNTVPNVNTATASFNGTITSQPDIGAGSYTIKALTVNATSSNVTLSGGAGLLTFDTAGISTPTFLTVADGKSLTFGSNVTLSANASVSAYNPTATLGNGSVLTFDSGKTLTVTGGNASRTLIISGGTIYFNSKLAGTPGNITTKGGGTMYFNPDTGSAAFAINSQGNATVNILNTNSTFGTISFDGSSGAASGKVYFRTTGNFTQAATTVFTGNAAGTSILGFDEATNATATGTLGALTVSANNVGITNQLYTGANKTLVTGTISAGNTTNTFEKAGAGTVTINGTNSYTGTILISDGTLQVGNNGTAGTLGTGPVTNNGTVVFKRSNAITQSGNITGTGSLTQAGAGTLTLDGTNTYTGTTTITAGTLQVGNGSTTGTLGTGSVTNNATLTFKRSDAITQSGNITGTGSLTQAGTGTLTLSGVNTYTGNTTVTAGTLQIGHDSALGNSTTAVLTLGGGAVDVNGFAPTVKQVTATQNGTISGAGNLTLASTTSSNLITVSAGKTLTLSSNATLNDSGFIGSQWTPIMIVNAGSVLTFDTGSTLRSVITGGNATSIAYQLQGSGVHNFNGAFIAGNTTTFSMTSSGTVNWNPSSITGGALMQMAGTEGAQINIYKNVTGLSYGSSGSGNRTVTVRADALALPALVTMGVANGAGGNPYKNVLAIDDGAATAISANMTSINLTSNVTFGTPTNELFAGDNDTMRFSGTIYRTGGNATTLVKSGNGTVVFSGNNTYTDATVITAGTLQIGNGGASGKLATTSAITNNGTLAFSRNNTVEQGVDFASVISGTGNVVQNGTSNLILSGTNTYTGNTTINGGGVGYLTILSDAGLGAAPGSATADKLVISNGALVVAGNMTLDSNRGVTLGGLGGQISVNASVTLTYGGIIAGSGLEKSGSGVLKLTGANTYTGGTLISAGTLQLGDGSTTGSLSTTGAITNNGTLAINRSNAVAQGTDFSAAAITGTGSFVQAGNGTTTLSAANTYTGNTTITAGTLSANATNALGGTARVTVTTGGTLLLSSNATVVNDSAAVDLNGGKVQIANTVSGLQETMGALTMGGNSTIDFGTGGTLANFNSLTLGQASWTEGAILNIWNWTGTPRTPGGYDRLLVSSTTGWSDNLSSINFFSDGGSTLIGGGGAMLVGLEIVAVPEPSTWIAMAALVLTGGTIAIRRRRQ